jgi:hypothetical protein
MHAKPNVFAMLASQASAGDPTARAELGRELEPQVVHMVRRVVQKGACASPLDRRIEAEAAKIGLDAASVAGPDGEFLVRQVARSVCSLVLAGIQRRTRDHYALDDTVCN